MKALRVRELTEEERAALEKGLHTSSALTLRRCQILLMSADTGLKPREIGARLRCSDQCVRDAIRAFQREGLACLQAKSHARHAAQAAFDAAGVARLKELILLSPRSLGYEASLWTLALLAEQCAQEQLTCWRVDADTVGATLKRAGIAWRRAKRWIKSPDPRYAVKKSAATG